MAYYSTTWPWCTPAATVSTPITAHRASWTCCVRWPAAWRRSSEHHENVLMDTSRIPGLLAGHGVDAVVRSSFGTEELPPGLRVVTGLRR
jgi:hypothetical protein